jgi:hypothetical protein
MLKSIIRPHIVKRFCHHSRETNFGRTVDKLNNIEKNTNFTYEKISKLEKNITEMQSLLVYNYFFTVIIIPSAILFVS